VEPPLDPNLGRKVKDCPGPGPENDYRRLNSVILNQAGSKDGQTVATTHADYNIILWRIGNVQLGLS